MAFLIEGQRFDSHGAAVEFARTLSAARKGRVTIYKEDHPFAGFDMVWERYENGRRRPVFRQR